MSSYIPLPTATSTRLVCLKPSPTLDIPVDVSLLTIDLAEPDRSQAYEAVSYTWGSKDDPAEIQLDGHPVIIRRNLYQGLLRLRHATSIRYLWVDAISISQDDLDEKAAQVQMIGKVFSLAEGVLIWLGEHADGSEELFRDLWSPKGVNRVFDTELAHDKDEIGRRTLIWTALLSRAYWSRTWIVQEITLARHIVIHCGGDLVIWEDMMRDRLHNEHANTENVFDCLVDGLSHDRRFSTIDPKEFRGFHKLMASFGDSVYHVRQIHSLRIKPGAMRDSILTIVRNLLKFKCENRLDRIYALLSLEDTTQVGYSEIKVDYTLSFPELLVDVLAKRYVFRPEQSWVDRLEEEYHSAYLSRTVRALLSTTKECNELRGLVLAKLRHAATQANSLTINRWSIVQEGLSMGIEEV